MKLLPEALSYRDRYHSLQHYRPGYSRLLFDTLRIDLHRLNSYGLLKLRVVRIRANGSDEPDVGCSKPLRLCCIGSCALQPTVKEFYKPILPSCELGPQSLFAPPRAR